MGTQRQAGNITILVAEQIEHEIADSARLAREVLEQIEDWSSVVSERDDLSIEHDSIGQGRATARRCTEIGDPELSPAPVKI